MAICLESHRRRKGESRDEEYDQTRWLTVSVVCAEVTRVAREVARKEARRPAEVRDGLGTWKDLRLGEFLLAGNLTGQVRNIADVTTRSPGDLSKTIRLCEGRNFGAEKPVNTMVDQLRLICVGG